VGEATVFEIGTSNDPDDRIALMAPGNVGIGTLTPSDKLDVAGNLRILTGSNPIRFTSSWSSFPDAVLNQAEICNDIGTYKTLMIVGNNSGGVGRRVSIWDRLEVNGRMSVSDGVIQKGGNPITNTADLGLYSQAAGYWMRFVTTGAGFWFFSDGGAGSNPIMTIDYTGNLTVGNSLYVNNLPFADRRNVQWDDRTKQFCYDNSSQRSKENITPLADEFTKLLAVEPKTYTRPDFPDTWEIGYIAEEFHDLGLDKLVYYNEDGSPGGINYPKIGLYLLEILKKHEQKFREYEEKIDRLEQQLSSS
jgi:Chaperone of endosialidase